MEQQDYAQYKRSHGLFMEQNNGTTFTETVIVLLPMPIGIVLNGLILHILCSYGGMPSVKLWKQFLIEFCLLVLPLQLSLTVCSDFVYIVIAIMNLVCTLLLIPTIKAAWRSSSMFLFLTVKEGKRPYITNFRSSVNLATSLCILAVDFNTFPRRFAKTETFGISLMDTGVGGFIFTNAIVAREVSNSITVAPPIAVWKSVISSIPLCLLGIIRLVSTHLLDYYVNVTEYGVHWNFFFTLAVCKVWSTVLLSVFPAKYSAILSFLVICLHEFSLASGIQDWVLSAAPRNNFFSANREGIISCSGYVAIYLAGVHVGRVLNFERVFLRDYLQLAVELLSASLLFIFVGGLVGHYLGVSRRLVNFGYFILTVAYNLIFLTVFLLAELVLIVFKYRTQQRREGNAEDKQATQITFVPAILASISYNGLLYFLVANFFTGIVNIYIKTIYLPVLEATLILTLYSIVLSLIVFILHVKQIKFKVW